MKTFRFFILLNFQYGLVHLVYASCGVHGISILPSSSTLPPNGQIIVVGYVEDQKVAEQLADNYPAFLVSFQEQVPLEVVEIYKGDFALTQAILRPQRPLKEGSSYRLMIQNLQPGSDLGKYDHRLNKYVPLKWTIEGISDLNPPEWKSPPLELRKHYYSPACGPDYGVEFSIESLDTSAALVKTSVRAFGETDWKTYYLEVIGHKIDIGCGMCSGAFSLRRAREFEATFELVDLAGNHTKLEGPPIRFTRPEEMNRD